MTKNSQQVPRLSLCDEPFDSNQRTVYQAFFKTKKLYFRKHRFGHHPAMAAACIRYSFLSQVILSHNSYLLNHTDCGVLREPSSIWIGVETRARVPERWMEGFRETQGSASVVR